MTVEEDEDPRVLQLKAHLQRDKWTGARITGWPWSYTSLSESLAVPAERGIVLLGYR